MQSFEFGRIPLILQNIVDLSANMIYSYYNKQSPSLCFENTLLHLSISGLDQVTYRFHPTYGDYFHGHEGPVFNFRFNRKSYIP